jgi:transposase
MAPYSLDLRQKIVGTYEAGNTSIRKVAEQFQVATKTVQTLLKQYRETGELNHKPLGSQIESPLEVHREKIFEIVSEHPDWSLWQYCEEVAEQTGVSVTTGSMCRFFQRHNITVKKKTYRSEKVKSDAVQQQRCEFWEALQDVKAEDLICIDETGVWQGMERSVARSESGKRVFSHRPFYKGQKYTVIGAISVDGIVCMKTILGSMKGEDFLTFIKDDLGPKLRSEHRVIMDNLNCHKVEGVVQAITDRGAKILYLPTYSPDFNPIEMMWSVLKYFIRLLRPQSQKLLQHLINIFPFLLEKDFFKNWFTKCCYCAT